MYKDGVEVALACVRRMRYLTGDQICLVGICPVYQNCTLLLKWYRGFAAMLVAFGWGIGPFYRG